MKQLVLLLCALSATAYAADDATLSATLSRIDTEMFDAFNQCDKPGELDKYASYFDAAIEFYHDNGGVTWTRDAMIANTAKYVCGHYSRRLVPGSLKVIPVKDFGAITTGSHVFCQSGSGKCEGIAEFTMVWRYKDDVWQVTRALSYGHRPNQ
ncbi:nuclear transport factor 2 family protein [Duganella callida]|uniref:Nuclear transport factor 2 family protein n=1 Tax=Duganella callida TaxID=2561932 RepID=A0A4Y9S5P9_9BURK|nr:nuclear transport factor 2 family protein [Duganella callida]TFW16689.1 nuclear transport factor 2 family protein [Duganella callida]